MWIGKEKKIQIVHDDWSKNALHIEILIYQHFVMLTGKGLFQYHIFLYLTTIPNNAI